MVAALMCSNPYIQGGLPFGCGQCIPCRVNKRRIWMHRIMLEATQYADNTFVTLTYDDDNLPEDGSLSVRDVQLFLKRLRKSFPRKLRFYSVGEYGDQTNRPHYHLCLFNYPNCQRGITDYSLRRKSCCSSCDAVKSLWSKGNIMLAELNDLTAQYVCGYVVKKMTRSDDYRLEGKKPEFARMSLRPGIGAWIIDDVASTLLLHNLPSCEGKSDVPKTLRHGSREMPLGRYLTRRLRERVGLAPEAPAHIFSEIRSSLRPVQEAADAHSPQIGGRSVFKELLIESTAPARNRLEARLHRCRKRGVL